MMKGNTGARRRPARESQAGAIEIDHPDLASFHEGSLSLNRSHWAISADNFFIRLTRRQTSSSRLALLASARSSNCATRPDLLPLGIEALKRLARGVGISNRIFMPQIYVSSVYTVQGKVAGPQAAFFCITSSPSSAALISLIRY